MAPYFQDDWLTVHGGDCRAVMREMPAESVQCVVTSPPYWGLRDYGTPGQLGLEPTPEAYVAAMVDVFREVRRVLRDDGTVWLNLGDSYASSGRSDRKESPGVGAKQEMSKPGRTLEWEAGGGHNFSWYIPSFGTRIKPKDLVGIPWRVAFALQADGWYLRSDIIWAKPNPMPESVTDRPTKAHEYLFLLSKSARYFYDADAVREVGEGARGGAPRKIHDARAQGRHGATSALNEPWESSAGRNLRSVWNIATAPYPGAHFATFPPKLVEPCIKAGTSERGVCPECGAPWERVRSERPYPAELANAKKAHGGIGNNLGGQRHQDWLAEHPRETTGWRPTCDHVDEELLLDGSYSAPQVKQPVPSVVLDPFAGTGTVGLVAASLSRRAVLIDLNPEYLRQCLERNRQAPLGIGA